MLLLTIRKENVRTMPRVLVMTASITASIPRGAHVEHTDLRGISFHHVRFLGLELVDVEINGVDPRIERDRLWPGCHCM